MERMGEILCAFSEPASKSEREVSNPIQGKISNVVLEDEGAEALPHDAAKLLT